MKTLIAAGVVLGLAGTAQAAGFGVDTQDARATGMATAVTASIDDASAVFYNAAGVVHGKGLDIRLGDTVIAPSITYAPGSGSTTGSKTSPVPPPNLYATYGITDDVAVGLGFYSPYGLASTWPSDWPGRYLAVDGSLSTYFINPEVAFKWERLKVGVGIDVVRGVVQISRALNFVDSDGTILLGGSGWGTGANLGAMVDILPNQLSIGAQYRGQVPLKMSGNVHFTGNPPELQQLQDQSINTNFTLPDTLQMGVTYRPLEALRLGFDVVWTNWSTFQSIDINFPNDATGTLNSSQPKRWKSTFNYHLGGEYSINEQIRVRAGLLYDPSPTPQDTLTPDLPDSNRLNIALGAGYKWHEFQADLGYQFVLLMSGTSTYPSFPGTYSGNAQVFGLTLSYRM